MAEKLISFLNQYGIDPLYFFAIMAIVNTLFWYKDIKYWKQTTGMEKFRFGGILSVTIVLVIASILRFFGVLSY
jgi:hypothetical protein